MSGASIQINAADIAAIDAALRGAINAAGAASTWAAVAAAGESVTEARLQSAPQGWADAPGIGPNGETWPAWSPAYAATREAGKWFLADSGELHDAITSKSSTTGAAWGVDTGIVYAATHHYGDKTRNIPARPFIGFGAAEQAAVRDALRDALGSALR